MSGIASEPGFEPKECLAPHAVVRRAGERDDGGSEGPRRPRRARSCHERVRTRHTACRDPRGPRSPIGKAVARRGAPARLQGRVTLDHEAAGV